MSPLAAALDILSVFHSKIPEGIPTPLGLVRVFALMSRLPSSSLPPAFDAVANMLTVPLIHVDHVGKAIAAAVNVDREDIRGVYGVRWMIALMYWRSVSPVYAR